MYGKYTDPASDTYGKGPSHGSSAPADADLADNAVTKTTVGARQ